jgi:hypothetical protein
MALDATETVIGFGSAISVAPLTAIVPANETAIPSGDWIDLGYATEDGVTITPNITKQRKGAWQTPDPVRSWTEMRQMTVAFTLEQWNGENMIVAFDGGEVTEVSSGHYKYTGPGPTDAEEQWQLMVDWADGSKLYRAVFPSVSLSQTGGINLKRAELAGLPLTFDTLRLEDTDPFILLTNDPAFAAAVVSS